MEARGVDYGAWALICIERWLIKMGRLRIKDTGALMRSFRQHVEKDANGDVAKIELTFLMYGWYVDAGVGNGYRRGNAGDLGFAPKRKPRHWYNKIYWNSFRRLEHLLAERYADEAVAVLKSIEQTI